MPSLPSETTDRMPCLEVWGGNTPVERGLSTAGLEVWVYSQPYQGAKFGGDVYYVSSCASGRITRLLLADVSGHGAGVASVSASLRDLMRRNVNLISQSRFVSEMNRQFVESSKMDEFATAIVCTYFSPTRSLQFCNAGHPVPLLFRAQEDRWMFAPEAARVETAREIADTPLGAVEEANYSLFEVKLTPGDMMMCFSDAFTEALDSQGHMLGAEGLLEITRKLDVSQPAGIVRQLIERITDGQQHNLAQDDASVLLFRADGSSPSLTSDLWTPFRFLRGVRDSTTFKHPEPQPS